MNIKLRRDPTSPQGEPLRVVIRFPAQVEGHFTITRHFSAIIVCVATVTAALVSDLEKRPKGPAYLVEQVRTHFNRGCTEVVCVVPESREPADIEREIRQVVEAAEQAAREQSESMLQSYGTGRAPLVPDTLPLPSGGMQR